MCCTYITGYILRPTSSNSKLIAYHALVVVLAWIEDGEVILLCKSSHGVEAHIDGTYIKVYVSIMLLQVHFNQGHARCGLKGGVIILA